MPEILTHVVVAQLLKKLRIAFPTHSGLKTSEQIAATAELYCESFTGLSGEALRAAVRIAIDTGKFFPKIAELRETAWEWTRRNRADIEPIFADPTYCPRCTTHVKTQRRWRPALDKDGFTIYSRDGQYVALEQYTRDLCACAAACLYAPEEEFDGDWMRADRIKWCFGRHRNARPSTRWRAPRVEVATAVGDIAETIVEGVLIHV